MIKPFLKTLSLSVVALTVAAAASAAEQKPVIYLASMPLESPLPAPMIGCSTQADVDRGWEYQQELLEARLAAKGDVVVSVPGAIITPPFENVVPYRTDAATRSEPKGKASVQKASVRNN